MGSPYKRVLVSQAEFARDRGVSRQSVGEWVKKHDIPLFDGKLDLELSRILWEKYRERPSRADSAPHSAGGSSGAQGSSTNPDGPGYWDSKARREAAEASIAEMKLAELGGKLVLRSEVDRVLFTASRVLRDQLLSVPPRLGAVLAPIADPKVIETRIAEELRIGLRAFAQQLRAGGVSEDGDGLAR